MTRDVGSLHPSEALKLQALFELDEYELRARYDAYAAELNRSGLHSADMFVGFILEFRNWHEKMIAILQKLYVLLQDKYAKESKHDFTSNLAEIESLLHQLEGKEEISDFKYRLEHLYTQLSRV